MPHQDHVKFTVSGHPDDSLGRVAGAQQRL
jgi:hypothetical protein